MDVFVRTEVQIKHIWKEPKDQTKSTWEGISISSGIEQSIHLKWSHYNDHHVMQIISINQGGWWNVTATPSGIRLGAGWIIFVSEPTLAGGWQETAERASRLALDLIQTTVPELSGNRNSMAGVQREYKYSICLHSRIYARIFIVSSYELRVHFQWHL